jgi:hypothetical protein
MKLKILTPLFLLFIFSCEHSYLSEKSIKEQAKHLMNNPNSSYFPKDGFVSNKEIAIKIAEPVLFNIYGEKNILKQKPYQVHLIDSVWVINGTIPEDMVGGNFWILINKRDGKILRVIHDK